MNINNVLNLPKEYLKNDPCLEYCQICKFEIWHEVMCQALNCKMDLKKFTSVLLWKISIGPISSDLGGKPTWRTERAVSEGYVKNNDGYSFGPAGPGSASSLGPARAEEHLSVFVKSLTYY